MEAEKELVLIDNYVDIGTLNVLAKKRQEVSVTIYTIKKTTLSEKDVSNFNRQYPPLMVKYIETNLRKYFEVVVSLDS